MQEGNPTKAGTAMDDALRAAEVGAHSAPGFFYTALEHIRDARIAFQQGREADTVEHLSDAKKTAAPAEGATPAVLEASSYDGATVVDQRGRIIGEVNDASTRELHLALGGWHRAWVSSTHDEQKRPSIALRSAHRKPSA